MHYLAICRHGISFLFLGFIVLGCTSLTNEDSAQVISESATVENSTKTTEVISTVDDDEILPTSECKDLECICRNLQCAEKLMECTMEGCHCTEIGCDSTLTINLAGNIPQDYIIEVSEDNGQIVTAHCQGDKPVVDGFAKEFRWGDAVQCGIEEVILHNFSPEKFAVILSWGESSISKTYEPTYDVQLPNGPECPPTCLHTRVDLEIPNNLK